MLKASRIKTATYVSATFTIAKDSELTKALQERAVVSPNGFLPCSVLLKVGTHSKRLDFPWPMDAAKVTTRIARRSLWIEVKAPLTSAFSAGGYHESPFPILFDKSLQSYSWSTQSVALSKCPAILTENTEN